MTLESAGVGLLVSAVKNALEKFVACSTTLIWADNKVDMIGELWGSSREQEEQSLSLVSLTHTLSYDGFIGDEQLPWASHTHSLKL